MFVYIQTLQKHNLKKKEKEEEPIPNNVVSHQMAMSPFFFIHNGIAQVKWESDVGINVKFSNF